MRTRQKSIGREFIRRTSQPIIASDLSANMTTRKLIYAANDAGGTDNVTAVVVDIKELKRFS